MSAFSEDTLVQQTTADYLSTYDFQRAVDAQATVPLYYSPRGEKLGVATTELNERIAAKLEEEATRDAVEVAIHNHLFSDDTGLPADAYTEEEVLALKSDVFRHVLRVYPVLPSPVFGSAA